MGLLDDAIRDHLDLKRRRGADPAEVERLEREALGPVRRNREPADPELDEPSAASAGEIAFEDEIAPVGDPSLYDDVPDGPAHDDWAYADADTGTGAGLPDVVDEPYPAAPLPDDPLDHLGDETAEYDVAAEHGHGEGRAGAESDEDMLEETPEFLQDTPDHDRLWFEQRPPRDFDFDN